MDCSDKRVTKRPISVAYITQLNLRGSKVFWDIGVCTVSVLMEAKLQFPHLDVYSFEFREKCREIIAYNCKKFGAMGITPIIGDFMQQDIELLPRPDAVFIGGHGGALGEIVKKVYQKLNSNGVLVFNSVSEESCRAFEEAVEECGRTINNRIEIKIDSFNTINILKA